jgi:hypothetical protein
MAHPMNVEFGQQPIRDAAAIDLSCRLLGV